MTKGDPMNDSVLPEESPLADFETAAQLRMSCLR